MARLKGRDVALYIDFSGTYQLVALATSCSIDVSCDMKEISSVLAGRAKEWKAGRYSWTVNIQSLIDVGKTFEGYILQRLCSGGGILLRMTIGTTRVSGLVLVSTWRAAGSVGGMASFTTSFIGNGALSL